MVPPEIERGMAQHLKKGTLSAFVHISLRWSSDVVFPPEIERGMAKNLKRALLVRISCRSGAYLFVEFAFIPFAILMSLTSINDHANPMVKLM